MSYPRVHLLFASFLCFVAASSGLRADPLTKQLEVDFGREVASRNLKGLATRSDGRVLPGPVFTDLTGPRMADILWTLRSTGQGAAGPSRFLVGTGPDGKVFEVAFNPQDSTYAVREVADVAEAQAVAVQPLADGSFLIGTSPTAAVYVAREGKVLARVPLPADSVFDFLALPDGSVLAATGNPGKIYRLDPARLAKTGIIEGKIGDDQVLADKGVTLFAEVRDRNVRRLARLSDGRVVAGSSPKGNVYAFAATGGAPVLLQEGRDAEVIDFLPQDDGSFYAAIVQSPGEAPRIIRTKPAVVAPGDDKDEKEAPPPAFGGRSMLVRFPVDGFPETVVSKAGASFYRIAQHQDWLLLTAGEQGDALGYDPLARRSLTFAGSASAQLNDLVPLGDGRFLAPRNNAPGLALLSFAPAPLRELETRRLDLGMPGELGLIRFARVRGLDPAALKLEARTNFGSDEIEGWSAWTRLEPRDNAFSAEGLRGRYLKLRLTVPAGATDFQIDKATVFSLPQNHRPQLNDFRIFPANLGLIPASEPSSSAVTTLGQVLFPSQQGPGKDEPAGDKRKNYFLGSQVVPQNGAQIIYWSVVDTDGDNLTYTLSIRPENSETWTDLAVDSRDSFVQFETGDMAEGLYLTRLTVREQTPRPEKQRLTYAFETDYLAIDRTPPVIADTKVERHKGKLMLTVTGRDTFSLLEGAEFVLNNGTREQTEHPADGILDSKAETFVAEIPEPKAAGATSVEIILYDASGNNSSRRLPVK